MGHNIMRIAGVALAAFLTAASLFGSPASADDGCYGVTTPSGDAGVCGGSGTGIPFSIGSVCVGSTCTPEKSGTLTVDIPTAYCTIGTVCQIN